MTEDLEAVTAVALLPKHLDVRRILAATRGMRAFVAAQHILEPHFRIDMLLCADHAVPNAFGEMLHRQHGIRLAEVGRERAIVRLAVGQLIGRRRAAIQLVGQQRFEPRVARIPTRLGRERRRRGERRRKAVVPVDRGRSKHAGKARKRHELTHDRTLRRPVRERLALAVVGHGRQTPRRC